MDTGYTEQKSEMKSIFEPLKLLLPDEILWIMDELLIREVRSLKDLIRYN